MPKKSKKTETPKTDELPPKNLDLEGGIHAKKPHTTFHKDVDTLDFRIDVKPKTNL